MEFFRAENRRSLGFDSLIESLGPVRTGFAERVSGPGRAGGGVGSETLELSVDGTTACFESGDQNGEDILRWTLDIEQEWLTDLLSEIEASDVFYDVGANLGFYSCFVANNLTDGRVVAFEPFPPNVDQLRTNLSRNRGEYTVIEKALSNERDTLSFTSTDGGEVGHATGTIAPEQGDTGRTIRTVRGDDLVNSEELPEPDVVKIDVEGSEPLVLEGLAETLAGDRCRLVYCEIHLPKDGRPSIRDYGYTADDVRSMIRKAGFRIDKENNRNGEIHLKAVR